MIGDESDDAAVYKGAIARDNESLAARTRERDIVRTFDVYTYINIYVVQVCVVH